MPSLNRLKRELLFKIVFYGPGLGGKTTTLQHIHASTKPENRGELVSLATDTDRTLYFDCMPLRILQIGDMTVKLQLFTVPGQVYYAATRKLVLNGADGVVYVADSQAARLDAALESLDDLNSNLADQGRKLSGLPHVFQWNKRDLADLVPLDELDRRLNLFGAPSMPTVATRGEGIFDVLERVTRLVIDSYRAELPVSPGSKPKALFLDSEEVGLADAIKGLADSQPARRMSPAPAIPPGPSPVAARPPSPAAAPPPAPAATRAASPAAAANPQTPPASKPQEKKAPPNMTAAPASPGTFSFSELWPPGDREAVRIAEHMIAARETAGAVTACEDLLTRVLAAGSVLLGGQAHPRDAAILVSLLGLDGIRYMAFRAIARGVRAKREPSVREALDCYAFVVEARRALDRVARGG
jgi:signal recognition particle receptor subunit beta